MSRATGRQGQAGAVGGAGAGRWAGQGGPHQRLLQALLVAAVQLLGLPRGAHSPVQSLSQVHEAGLVLGQLVADAGGQRLVPLPAAGQLLLHAGQHWPRPGTDTVTGAVIPGAHPPGPHLSP